jgi:hypothetical protein
MPIAFVARNSGNQVGTSVTINVPAGTVTGNLLIALVMDKNGGTTGTTLVIPPGGWREFNNSPARVEPTGGGVPQPAASPLRLFYYYRFATAADIGASYVWTLPSNSGPISHMLAYSGVDRDNPINAEGVSLKVDDTAPFGNFIAAGITTTSQDTFLISIHAANDVGGSAGFSPPTGMTERVELTIGARNLSINEQAVFAAPAATGDRTPTVFPTLDVISGTGIAFIFALAPDIPGVGLGSGSPSPSSVMVLPTPITIPMRQHFHVLAEFFVVGSTDALDLINNGADDDYKVIEFHFNGILTREVN